MLNTMVDFVVVGVLLLVLGAAAFYLIRAKKRGQRCVGCPCAKSCGGKCGEKPKNETR
ncbi:MAG: FeoB-associated Cys-rich membrane protein [Ruminococcaceae bacterium]|nr:FeoB-associated Cys-rich membrane protein [Oscillospiraceae bacterium]